MNTSKTKLEMTGESLVFTGIIFLLFELLQLSFFLAMAKG